MQSFFRLLRPISGQTIFVMEKSILMTL